MPTPFELLLDPVSLIIIALYAGLWLAETLWPGRDLPPIPGARARGIVWFTLFFFGSSYLPYLWADAIAPYRLLDLTAWPQPLAILAGVLSYELVGYAYHRSLHTSDFLFRTVHQMHHSSERLDVASSFYFHPLDIVGWTAVTSVGLSVLVGLSPEATSGAVLFLTFLSVFQHANIRTPHWLGYIVQRPESHSRHHGRGWHRNNYADLPLFDMAFGTFENPADFEGETGYYDGASTEVGRLLVGRSVHRGPEMIVSAELQPGDARSSSARSTNSSARSEYAR